MSTASFRRPRALFKSRLARVRSSLNEKIDIVPVSAQSSISTITIANVVSYLAAAMPPLLDVLSKKGKNQTTDSAPTASALTSPHLVEREIVSEVTAPISAE
jgi:hypothetical protein